MLLSTYLVPFRGNANSKLSDWKKSDCLQTSGRDSSMSSQRTTLSFIGRLMQNSKNTTVTLKQSIS